MQFLVEHHTEYVFSGPVFLEPHILRLTPRQDACQRLRDFSLHIDPEPAGLWQGLDQEGNPFVQAWFDGLHPSLAITTRLEAETLRANPFAFLPVAQAATAPPGLSPAEALALASCLRREAPDGTDGPGELAASLRAGSDGCQGFLLALNARLFERLKKVVRREPGIQTPAETLASGRGACRDAAVLFMDCCRSVGVPARFVSGYQAGEDGEDDDRDLHAWAEAWLPGAGWLGFDPTHGLLTADRHLALAASHDPALAAPLTGSFRGTGLSARPDDPRHELRVTLSS